MGRIVRRAQSQSQSQGGQSQQQQQQQQQQQTEEDTPVQDVTENQLFTPSTTDKVIPGATVNLQWLNPTGDRVSLGLLSSADGWNSVAVVIAKSITNIGAYTWLVPSDVPSDVWYSIRIQYDDNPDNFSDSDIFFMAPAVVPTAETRVSSTSIAVDPASSSSSSLTSSLPSPSPSSLSSSIDSTTRIANFDVTTAFDLSTSLESMLSTSLLPTTSSFVRTTMQTSVSNAPSSLSSSTAFEGISPTLASSGQPTTSNNQAESGSPSPPTGTRLPTGMIVGAAIGAIALLVFGALGALWLIGRERRKRAQTSTRTISRGIDGDRSVTENADPSSCSPPTWERRTSSSLSTETVLKVEIPEHVRLKETRPVYETMAISELDDEKRATAGDSYRYA